MNTSGLIAYGGLVQSARGLYGKHLRIQLRNEKGGLDVSERNTDTVSKELQGNWNKVLCAY